MILAVAIGTSVLAGFIGLPYTWYRYHLAWVGWLRVLLVFFLTAVANAALAALGALGVHASGKHPPWLAAGVALGVAAQVVMRVHVGSLAAQVEPTESGRTTQPEQGTVSPSTLLSQTVRWLNSALDSVTRKKVHDVTHTWTDDQLGNASWNVFEATQAEKGAGGLLTKAEEEVADGLVQLLKSMQGTDQVTSRRARGVARHVQ